MKHNTTFLFAFATALSLPLTSLAEKSGYSLLNPTPAESMRPMRTDKPARTLKPYTVDAGHFQVEMDFVNYRYDEIQSFGSTLEIEGFSYGMTTLKAGLLHNLDMEVELAPYAVAEGKNRSIGVSQRLSGFGDVELRFKANLWGKDGGTTSLAVFPFVRFPTGRYSRGNYMGGALMPLAVELPQGWNLGAMTGIFLNETTTGFINSASISRELFASVSGYAEFYSVVTRHGNWTGSTGVGFAYDVCPNLRLHLGSNFGVTGAPDFNPFIGGAWRF